MQVKLEKNEWRRKNEEHNNFVIISVKISIAYLHNNTLKAFTCSKLLFTQVIISQIEVNINMNNNSINNNNNNNNNNN